MTLLEQINKISETPKTPNQQPLKYPIPFSSNSILSNLQIENPNPNSSNLLNPLTGFEISQIDTSLLEFNSKFFKTLNSKLKSPKSLNKLGFGELINSFLEGIGGIKYGGLGDLEMGSDFDDYTCKLIVKFGSFVGRDVLGLVIEGCLLVENWIVLATLIENNLVDFEERSGLLSKLIEKKRSELIVLCVIHFGGLKSSDLSSVLKYFLSPTKDGLLSLGEVRKKWEIEALFAINKAGDNKFSGRNLDLAKEAALLFMIAYDGFSSWELCLHYLVSSSVDDVVFPSAISKLNVSEILGLIRYLGKWLSKYERFPEAGATPEVCMEVKLAQWVPKVEVVIKCLGLVVDEHYTTLAMHSEFREELKAIEAVVGSLASEGKLCSSVANLISILNPEVVAA